jgi:hypothetical protein
VSGMAQLVLVMAAGVCGAIRAQDTPALKCCLVA